MQRKVAVTVQKSRNFSKLPQLLHCHRGFTLIELIITISLIGLVFVGIFGVLQSALVLVSEGKIRTTGNAIMVEQIEKIRSLQYSQVGTYIDDGTCTYGVDCAVGSPAGPIPQTQSVELNNIDYQIESFVDYVDDPEDGTGDSGADPDSNGVTTDYKVIEVVVSWAGRSGNDYLKITSTVAPPGVETSLGGGSLRVNVIDSAGNPVPGLEVRIINNTTAPTISQPGVTDADGRRLLSTLPQASGYEVYVNLSTSDLDGNGLLDDRLDTNYGYARVYTDGEVWPFANTTKVLTSPNPDKLTVEEGLVTTITFIVNKTADLSLTAREESTQYDISDPFFDAGLLDQNQTTVELGSLRLADNEISGGKFASGVARTVLLDTESQLLSWLWFEANATALSSSETVLVKFYYDEAGVTTLIPEADLQGNEAGFKVEDPVDLQGLPPNTYQSVAVEFILAGDGLNTPIVNSATLTALQTGEPVTSADLRLYGVEWVGKHSDDPSEKIWKYDFHLVTDSTGSASVTDLAADHYRPVWQNLPSYTPIATCPAASGGFTFAPAVDQDIISVWRQDSAVTDSLVVRVQSADGNTVYPGVNLVLKGATALDGDVFPRVGLTNECGHYSFGELPGGDYELELSGPDVSARSSLITISGATDYTEEI